MKTIDRKCWWCNTRLSSTSHAEVMIPGGLHIVWVHKVCEDDTKKYLGIKPITAQPSDQATKVK